MWQAWLSICGLYSNRIAPSVNAPRYSIDRRAYRGLLHPHEDSHQAGIAVVCLFNLVVRPGLPPLFSERACLRIECNSHDRGTIDDWKDLMEESTESLAFVHGTRMIYLILAIGLKCIMFRWDPTSTLSSQPLKFPAHGEGDCSLVDLRIRPLDQDRYIEAGQDGRLTIEPRHAHSLDYWSLDPNTNMPMNWDS